MITFDGQDQEDGLVAHIVENDVTLHALKEQMPEHVKVSEFFSIMSVIFSLCFKS